MMGPPPRPIRTEVPDDRVRAWGGTTMTQQVSAPRAHAMTSANVAGVVVLNPPKAERVDLDPADEVVVVTTR